MMTLTACATSSRAVRKETRVQLDPQLPEILACLQKSHYLRVDDEAQELVCASTCGLAYPSATRSPRPADRRGRHLRRSSMPMLPTTSPY
jgi:hypothetical protein